jgi:hypothetical protein
VKVQICETYRQPREKNKQAKKTKYDPLHLSTKEILKKEYEYKIINRINESTTRPLQMKIP